VIWAEDGAAVRPEVRGFLDAAAAAIINSREDWPQRKSRSGLSPARLGGAAGSLWQRPSEPFRGNTEGGGGGPSDDACSTQPRIRPRHPAVDRTVVTGLVWRPRVPQRSRGEA
jgi:hypothetical protein